MPQNYLILGTTSDTGQEIAKRLHEQGAKLFLSARNEERLAEIAGRFDAPYQTADGADFDAVMDVFKQAGEKLGGLNGVVNCAGSIMLRPAHQTSQADYDKTMAANITTAFAAVRGAGAVMKDGGSVVLFSTGASLLGVPAHEAIAAAKGAINGLVLSAAATYAGQGIRVNAVAPGLVETKLSKALTAPGPMRQASESMHALGRLGTTDDVASAACFLLDPANSWITGQVLAVDGGLSTVRPKGKA